MLKRFIAVLAAAAVMAGPAAATAAAPEKNIVQTAIAAGKFDTLVKLVKRAGLAGTLSGTTKYTVFAPTDRAFAKVPKRTLNTLMNNRRLLRKVLLYHVIVGKRNAKSLIRFPRPMTAEGSRLEITTEGSKAFVNGRRILLTDVRATNGIIHAIGGVLIPPNM